MNEYMLGILKKAKYASRNMMLIDSNTKNKALISISKALKENINTILEANQIDIDNAIENNMSKAMQDRLYLNEERIIEIANSVEKLCHLEDPIGQVIRNIDRPNGLSIKQVRVPIGVFGIIYESRPNVSVDIACLCLKSSNVCILKGGKEAINSNKALVSIMNQAIKGILPENIIQLIENNDRSLVGELIHANEYVDVVVPRGGAGLINYVVKNATVPVIETGAGICHLYIDKDASIDKAINISINAKMQRPSVCNSIETILVHKDKAKEYLTKLKKVFDGKVEIRGCKRVLEYIDCKKATDEDWATEYDDYIISIKIVDDINEAIDHIYKYSTKHSEAIISENKQAQELFLNALDSACLYVNTSTRFSDGGEFGFGAELGISTQKLHARGPLGLQEMTSYKYLIHSDGKIRE